MGDRILSSLNELIGFINNNLKNVKQLKIIPLNDFGIKYRIIDKNNYISFLKKYIREDSKITYSTFKDVNLINTRVASVDNMDSSYRVVIIVKE